MSVVLLLARFLLTAVFLVAGLAKLADRGSAPRGRRGALLYGSTSEVAGRTDRRPRSEAN